MKFILLSVASLALSTGAALAQDVVRIGTEGAYPPYNFVNDGGHVDGFERELGDRICEIAKLNCEWVTNDWDSIIPNLQSGNYDVIMAGMSITDERKSVIDFSEAYTPPSPSAYAALSADVDVNSVVVAAQTGTIQAAHVAETGATLLEFPTPDETIAALRNGEADAVMADRDYLAPFVDESNGEITWVGDPVPLGGGIGAGFRKSDTELRDKFSTAVAELKASGEMNQLIVKWLGADADVWQ